MKLDDFIAKGATLADLEALPRIGREALQWAFDDWEPPADRPMIDVEQTLDELSGRSWQALEAANDPPTVFRRGEMLAWIHEDDTGALALEHMNVDHVRHRLADVATFFRKRQRGLRPSIPPMALCADIVAVPRRLPRLTALVNTPIFAADGRLLVRSGYDPSSTLYLAMARDLRIPPVPVAPSTADIVTAVALLKNELFSATFLSRPPPISLMRSRSC